MIYVLVGLLCAYLWIKFMLAYSGVLLFIVIVLSILASPGRDGRRG